MLRIITLVTTFIILNADLILSYTPSNSGFKTYDYGSGNLEKYSKGSSKYFLSSGSSPANVNSGLSSNYPSSIYSNSHQDDSITDQTSSNYENLDNSYLSDGQSSTTLSGYSRDRPYSTTSDYSSSQSDYTGSSNSQPEFSGRTDYEGAALNDYSGSATQQYTVSTSYRGSGHENYPGSQEATNVRGFVTANQGSSAASSGFVGSPSYPDPSLNRGVYSGNNGFKALDVSGFRGYHPGSGAREYVGNGKHKGHVVSVSSKYPIYETPSSDGHSGNEVEYTPTYSSPHAYSAGNYKRESYNSGGGAPNAAFSGSGFNFLPASLKGSYQSVGIKAHPSAFPGGIRESGPSAIHFSGIGSHGSEGTRFMISGGSPNYASYPSNPSLPPKGHGSYLLGGNGSPGKIIILKENSNGSPHPSSSSHHGGHMYSNAPIIGGSFKTTRGASYGGQGASFSYTPSFAGGLSPSYTSRFTSGGHGGGNPYSSYMSAS